MISLLEKIKKAKEFFSKDKIIEKLRENICEVTFVKVDGTERVLIATLHPSYMSDSTNANHSAKDKMTPNDVKDDGVTPKRKRTGNFNPDLVSVIDTEITQGDAWRSFKISTLKGFKIIKKVEEK